MSDVTFTADLRPLSDDECRTLLLRHSLGRLGLQVDGRPTVLPVNYAFDGNSVVIRTAPGTKLDQAPLRYAAFEIDGADRFGHWGWSVLVQGPAFDISSSLDRLSEHLRTLEVRPWAPGKREERLMIEAREISGRLFGTPETDWMSSGT